jgi:hypothetical protein
VNIPCALMLTCVPARLDTTSNQHKITTRAKGTAMGWRIYNRSDKIMSFFIGYTPITETIRLIVSRFKLLINNEPCNNVRHNEKHNLDPVPYLDFMRPNGMNVRFNKLNRPHTSKALRKMNSYKLFSLISYQFMF